MQTFNRESLEDSLYSLLPKDQHASVPLIATIITNAATGLISADQAKEIVGTSAGTAQTIQALAGKEVAVANATISFGQGNQLGDVQIRDVAGNNITHFTINIQAPPAEAPRRPADWSAQGALFRFGGILLALLSCIAAWIVVPELRQAAGLDRQATITPATPPPSSAAIVAPAAPPAPSPAAGTASAPASPAPTEPALATAEAPTAEPPPASFPCPAEITPSGGTVVIARQSAFIDAPARSQIAAGTVVSVVQQSAATSAEAWYLVVNPEGRQLGWVSQTDLRLGPSCPL